MHYQVTFIGESDLPSGHDWLLAECGDEYRLFIKRHAVTPATLSECWAAYVEMAAENVGRPAIPAPRRTVAELAL